MSSSIGTILSVIFGGLITWFFSWKYYKRAGDDLRREADILRKATDAILYIQQNPNSKVDVQRDDHGHVTVLLVNISGSAIMTSSAVGNLTAE